MAPSLKLSPSHQKIVNVVAALSDGLRGEALLRKKVMCMTGYAPKNTGFVVALSTLKNKKKCLVYDSDTITLLDLGWELAEPVEDLQASSNQEHMDKFRSQLKGNKAKMIFDFLAKDGQKHTRYKVAQAVGYDHAKSVGDSPWPFRSSPPRIS